MATSRFGFERHGGGPSVRERAVVLRRPAPDANRPDPCKVAKRESVARYFAAPESPRTREATRAGAGLAGC
jgi:hypothetical protein